jgi:hypothetical protein
MEVWRAPAAPGLAAENTRDHSLWLIDYDCQITHLSATGQVLWQGGAYEGHLSNLWVSPVNGQVWCHFTQGSESPAPLLVGRDSSGAELSRLTVYWLAGNEVDGSVWVQDYEGGEQRAVAQLDAGGTELRHFFYDDLSGPLVYSQYDNSFWSMRDSGAYYRDFPLVHRGQDGSVQQEVPWPKTRMIGSIPDPEKGSVWARQGDDWVRFSPEGAELERRAEGAPSLVLAGLVISPYDSSWWESYTADGTSLVRHLAPDGTELSTHSGFTYSPVVNPTDGSVWGARFPSGGYPGYPATLQRLTADGELQWTRTYTTTSYLMQPILEPDGSAWVVIRSESGDTREHISSAGEYLGDLPFPAAMRDAYVDWLPYPVQTISTFGQAPDGTVYALFANWSEGHMQVIGGGVRRLTHDGAVLWERADLVDPYYLAIDPVDNSVWVSDGGVVDGQGYGARSSVSHYAADGTLLWQGTTFNNASRISLDPRDGSVWSEDYGGRQILHLVIIPAPFADISGDCWAFDAIKACAEAGIVGGYEDGTYRPDLTVTRDQMAVFISRALAGGEGGVPTGPPTATFFDVPTDHWAFKYVEYAADRDVVGGYSDDSYRPSTVVTRDAMAVFVARAVCGGESSVPAGPATASFSDVPTDHWAFRHVECLRGEGVVSGYGDGTYRPLVVISRDQMAVYIQRAFGL